MGEGTSPKLALGLGFEKQAPFSIPNQVEVVSSIPGEVVAGDDIFLFLRHTLLVFFGSVGGAGTGSSDVGWTISRSSHTVLVMKSEIFWSSSAGSVGGHESPNLLR